MGAIKEANKKEFVITHFINLKDRPDYFQYSGKEYNTLEELKAENGITENDNIFTMNIVIIHSKEDIDKYK